jgi:hypothetical protein
LHGAIIARIDRLGPNEQFWNSEILLTKFFFGNPDENQEGKF